MPLEEGTQEEEVVVEGTEAETPAPKAKTPEAPEYTDTELKAMEQGWKPLPEWDGDPNDHRSAREFLDRGDLLSKIKSQGSELRQVREMMSHLSEQNKGVYKAGYERALVDLRARKATALREGDMEEVVAIEERIDQHKDAIAALNKAQAHQVPQGPTPTYLSWLDANPWYTQDRSLQHWANGMAADYGMDNPNVSEKEVLDFLHKEIRKAFPDRFKKTSAVRGAPQPDSQGRRNGSAQSAGKSGKDAFDDLLSGMDEMAQRAARNLVKQGYVTKEKYVEDYNAASGSR
jgi:hypothetical protein